MPTRRRVDEEIQFHLEQQTARNIAAGMTPDEARRAALIAFGGVERTREAAHDLRAAAWLGDLARDLRIGARTLARTPGFTLAVVATLGLGIGVSMALFSVFRDVLLTPLPYPDSHRIVRLYQVNDGGTRANVSQPNFDDWRAGTHSFERMALAAWWGPQPVSGAGDAQLARVSAVSREFFDVMGIAPALGRFFHPDEQRTGAPRVAVVSAAFWQAWRGDARPAGEVLRSGSTSFTVVGVMPPGFDYPARTAIWVALEVDPPHTSRTAHNFQAVARVRNGIALDAAQADLSAVSRALKTRHGEQTWMLDAEAVPLLDVLTSTSRPTLQVLLAAAIVLLLVSLTSVSNLLLARAAARRREFAVQLAIGAPVGRVMRHVLAETLLLCLAGAAAGVVLAAGAVRLFVALAPATVARLDAVAVSWPAVALAVLVSTLAALVLTASVAAGARSMRLTDVLTDGSRTIGTRRQVRMREVLIVLQTALAVVLLAAAALLGRSMASVLAIDPGFAVDDALVAGMTYPRDGTAASRVRQVAFQEELLERIRAIPGVTHAGLVNDFPLGGGRYSSGQFLEMSRPDEITSFDEVNLADPAFRARVGSADFRVVSDGYFETMDVPLLRGRLIDAGDGPTAPHVAVISQSLADARWPDRDPLGRWIQFGNMDGDLRGLRIVGVVGDVRELTPEADPAPMLYVSARQRPGQASQFSIVVRGPAPEAIAPDVRRLARELAPDVPVSIRTVAEAFDSAVGTRRFNLWLIAAFSAVALALASLGLYGLVAYTVSQRAREMGLRIALGARPFQCVKLVVIRGLRLAAAGAALGLSLAFVFGRIIEGLLYGVTPADPLMLAAAAVVLLVAALAACYIPARSILRQPPGKSLREV